MESWKWLKKDELEDSTITFYLNECEQGTWPLSVSLFSYESVRINEIMHVNRVACSNLFGSQ